MSLVEALPTINASLNATSFLFVFVGWRAVKAKRVELHKKCMVAAFIASTLFLTGYLTRMALTGTHRFDGDGALRIVYLTILFSHMILAVVVVPLVLRTFYLALKRRIAEHRRIVRYTLPIWMYVSLTGVMVYIMLYRL